MAIKQNPTNVGFAFKTTCVVAISLALASCDKSQTSTANVQAEEFKWPASLKPFGTGFPDETSTCRQLGESAATANYLDDSAILVGCPGGPSDIAAKQIITTKGGRVIDGIGGVTLLSVPMQ